MRKLTKPAVAASLVCSVLLASAATYEDYGRAREAVERGEILPLTEILERVEREHGGRMIEIELELEGEGVFYELELIQPNGRVIEVLVDAATGETLSLEVEDD
ncbi:PepSY domain-containing protein [Amaricoccus macauensis]|uniref:PepSY domain-containing protein n=1 Tax=Amaricoccus macauensis TaxID=57001 RepID=UPI003C7E8207